jgi:DNA-binding transcriptional ArsR family regulator
MGISKTDVFTEKQNSLALIAKALGHPARIAIVEFLLKHKTCICKNIVDELPLSQATISQHLKELKNAGLIKGTIEGNSICYCLSENAFQTLSNYSQNILNSIQQVDSTCCPKT